MRAFSLLVSAGPQPRESEQTGKQIFREYLSPVPAVLAGASVQWRQHHRFALMSFSALSPGCRWAEQGAQTRARFRDLYPARGDKAGRVQRRGAMLCASIGLKGPH